MSASRLLRIVWFVFLGVTVACGGAGPHPSSQTVPLLPAKGQGAVVTAVVERSASTAEGDEVEAAVPIRADDPVLGSRTAPVTLVVFTDLECPFCAKLAMTLDALQKKYGREVLRIVFKHQPLPMHAQARPAAEIAEGVRRTAGNEAFFAFADRVFANQRSLSSENLLLWAQEVGARGDRVAADASKVDFDMALAKKLGVNGTPTSYVNGIFVNGAQSLEKFQAIIDSEVNETTNLLSAGRSPYKIYAERTAVNLQAKPREDEEEEEDTKSVWKVPVGNSPFLGPRDALVTIIEFFDYQCPFCGRVQPTLSQIRSTYGSNVRIVLKQQPLPMHPRALPAANLAIEARVQKGDAGFALVHEQLFLQQRNLDDANLEAIALAAGLDLTKARQAIATNKHALVIEEDQGLAEDFQASGTPHFFINGRRVVGARPFESFQKIIDEEVVRATKALNNGAVRATLYDTLIKDGRTPSPPTRVTPPAAPLTLPARGNLMSKVTVQLFSDFQCPYCRSAMALFDDMVKAYGSRVRFVWRNFPLDFHAQARIAATAAMEAFKQKGPGGFWKMEEVLFGNQQAGFERSALETYAKQVGLDLTKFNDALDNDRHAAAIDRDIAEGKTAGVSGTPELFIGGYRASGMPSRVRFKRLVERAIADAK